MKRLLALLPDEDWVLLPLLLDEDVLDRPSPNFLNILVYLCMCVVYVCVVDMYEDGGDIN